MRCVFIDFSAFFVGVFTLPPGAEHGNGIERRTAKNSLDWHLGQTFGGPQAPVVARVAPAGAEGAGPRLSEAHRG